MPRRRHPTPGLAFLLLACATLLAGACDGPQTDRRAPTAAPPNDPAGLEGQLAGVYGARLDAAKLRRLTGSIRPRLQLPGGWWTLSIDVTAARLTLAHPGLGDTVQRIVAIDRTQLVLAPNLGCAQRGAARLQPARLTWWRIGDRLRLKAVHVPCRADEALLTSAVWQRS